MPTIKEQLGGAAIDTAKGVINTGLGLILQRGQDKRQLNMQRKLQRMEMEGTKEMTDYNFNKQLEMWKATNYQAQMEQLRLAGLNPGMIYGMSGGRGATTNIEQGKTTGAHAPTGGGEIQSMLSMGIQRELLQAQKENIQAQTEKTKAETTAVAPGIEKTKAETASLTQGIENQKAQKTLIEVETSIKNTEDFIKGKTQNMQIAILATELKEATERLGIIQNEHKLSDATIDEKEKIIERELINIGLRNSQALKNLRLTEAQIAEIGQKILTMWHNRKMDYRNLTQRELEMEVERQANDLRDPNLTPQINSIIGGIIGGILGGRTTTGTQPIRGFHNRN